MQRRGLYAPPFSLHVRFTAAASAKRFYDQHSGAANRCLQTFTLMLFATLQ